MRVFTFFSYGDVSAHVVHDFKVSCQQQEVFGPIAVFDIY